MHELYHLAKMCLQSNCFSYRGTIYKQITGTPMGSPVSFVIAEIVMQEIERKILCLPNNFMFWYHYVDDIISCIPRNKLNESLDLINSVDCDIQFTLEVENNNYCILAFRPRFN